MTKEEFLNLQGGPSSLPIMLADGRMGLCNHWTETEILVDAYKGNDGEQIRVPFASIVDTGGGALKENVSNDLKESHKSAKAAMWLFGSEYGPQSLGINDFYDQLPDNRKDMCRQMVTEIEKAPPEETT